LGLSFLLKNLEKKLNKKYNKVSQPVKNGTFAQVKILISIFSTECDNSSEVEKALKEKGFSVTILFDEQQIIHSLQSLEYDIAWIISANEKASPKYDKQAFQDAVVKFYRSGRGLFVWGDNAPYVREANYILPNLAKCKLIGCDPGDKILRFGNPTETGFYDKKHIIFAGVNSLHEGITISYPDNTTQVTVLATNSSGHPCICCLESNEQRGRLVIETGYTKLFKGYWEKAAQARYVVNVSVWLLEGRFGK